MKHVGLRSNAKDIASQEQLGDLAIIYPNGGTAGSPANAAVNTRYVSDNPFTGFQVFCVAEIYLDGEWCETGWYNSSSSLAAGIRAGYRADKVITVTGVSGLHVGWQIGGGTTTRTSNADVTSAPFRVKVWKVKGAA